MAKNRIAALLAQMASTAALVDGLIAKAKGEPLPAKPEPQAPRIAGSGSRSYRVSEWRATCKGCPRDGKCGMDKWECENARWFPIVHHVGVVVREGVVVSTTCREGRSPGGPPCSDPKCKHVDRVLKVMGGAADKGVEVVMVSGTAPTVPRCPSCRERWGVTARGDGRFECRSPVCERGGRPWVFAEGDTAKPPPMRHTLVIGRDPGRVVVKRES